MKVLHVCESVTGGIATYLNELIPHQISLYGIENVRLIVAREQAKEIILPSRVIVTFEQLSRSSLVAQYRMSQTYFKQVKDFQPSVVHVHSTFAGLWFRLPLLWKKKKPYKVVYCSHGWAFDMQKPMWIKHIFAFAEKALLHCTDNVVCISEHDKKLAASFGISTKKLKVVKNTVELADKKITPVDLDPNLINYLYVGRFDEQKGFDILSDAVHASENRNFRVYCIGGAVVSSTDTAQCFEDPRLIALGWKPKNEVLRYMKGCEALIVPSRWEGFGLVALEALVCGCPVFHSGAGGLPEILPNSEYSTQLAAPMVESIQKLFDRTSKRMLVERKRQLSKVFKLTYTVKNLAEELNEIYKN
ncbi:glycosyltransferase [Alteromonas sp. 345S023]|uniref:Glycosyltransferase n=1 Tax=Alteromonas profundi TaxID=2696062 RepID=A0A7X5LIG9_9ALTE|nr:glycosyltransferase family 4 protein [Alteromonas profundi]NDV89961.1 glycosyltransferase [Alteromonas profundi]